MNTLHAPSTLVFDMDGVLLDSNGIKHAAMLDLFDVDAETKMVIDRYNRSAGGVPRARKFSHIWSSILRRPFDDEVEKSLSRAYALRLGSRLKAAPMVPGVIDFISSCGRPCFVCTSAPESEAVETLEHKGFRSLFRQVFGAPVSKTEALHRICTSPSLVPRKVVFFGDAMADLQAARAAGTEFIGITRESDNFAAEPIVKLAGFDDRESLIVALRLAGSEDIVV